VPSLNVACPVCIEHAETVFRVEGLCCADEVVLLERRLTRLPGLAALSADVVGQRIRVHHDAARLSVAHIAQEVADAGLRAWKHDETPARPTVGRTWSRGAWVALSGTLLALALAAAALGAPAWLRALALAASAVVGGAPIVRRAIAALKVRSLDINVLMLIAVVGAAAIGEWVEGATVVFLFALAQWLETRSMERVRRSVRALMGASPAEALVHRGDVETIVSVADVAVGDLVIIRPGERVPLDGDVVGGDSEVDEATVTGESMPVAKGVGARLFAGTLNGSGSLEMRVAHLVGDSTIARITDMVERAQAERAPTQAWVDRFARVYTPVILILALALVVLGPLVTGDAFGSWLYRALVLLVIACPCALVISTPVAIVSGLTAAARNGVLIKGGRHLERLAEVRAAAFDKTGTLTTGKLAVDTVQALDGIDPDRLLQLAAAVEARSQHPIARAIVQRASLVGRPPRPAEFRSWPGRGAEGLVEGVRVLVGNERLLRERGIQANGVPLELARLATDGATPVFVSIDDRLSGLISVRDEVRADAQRALDELRQRAIRPLVVLTGDHAAAAEAVSRRVGADAVSSRLLPEDKVLAVKELRREAGAVLMVGDGVNDAPALAAADVGMAMGAAASDVALETADVALMGEDLARIPFVTALSRATLATVKANIGIALGLKAVFLGLGVVGLATLWMAVVADMGASLLVTANALRLLRLKPART
jgi:Zn2+/Cd2+-exporting ATPase